MSKTKRPHIPGASGRISEVIRGVIPASSRMHPLDTSVRAGRF
jgi:hypothetical protein